MALGKKIVAAVKQIQAQRTTSAGGGGFITPMPANNTGKRTQGPVAGLVIKAIKSK